MYGRYVRAIRIGHFSLLTSSLQYYLQDTVHILSNLQLYTKEIFMTRHLTTGDVIARTSRRVIG